MKKPQDSTLNRQILEEASEWFVDFRVGDVDGPARARFDEWLRRSPEHIRAYMDIARTYVELPSITDSGKLDVAALIAFAHSDGNVVPLHPGSAPQAPAASRGPVPPGGPNAGRPSRSRVWRRPILVAASVAFVLAIAGTLWWQTQRYPLFTTDIGERRSITLADGSTVDLNARSRLRIEFSSTERRVELLGGQALFQVAKDKHRPFIVASGEATVRAVGTEFDVYRKDSGTTVTVLEGRVAVYTSGAHAGSAGSIEATTPPASAGQGASTQSATSAHAGHTTAGAVPDVSPLPAGLADPSSTGALFLSAGEQVTVTPAAMIESHHADLTVATAWTQRKLIFDGSKLSDVVEEFNRYNRRQLILEGNALSDFHVSGVYSSTDPASLLRFLSEQSGVKITEGENDIRIEAQ
jgi:transmembrane sensor